MQLIFDRIFIRILKLIKVCASLMLPNYMLIRKRRNFAGLYPAKEMQNLKINGFEQIHDHHFSFYNSKADVNSTKLRNYYILHYANLALKYDKSGILLFCGVSYGVTVRILAEMLYNKFPNLSMYLVDPLDGRTPWKTLAYNTNPKLVTDLINPDIKLNFFLEPLAPKFVTDIPGTLQFIVLNTTDYSAEVEALPLLIEKMTDSAILIIELFGFFSIEQQENINRVLVELNTVFFELPTMQLVVHKS